MKGSGRVLKPFPTPYSSYAVLMTTITFFIVKYKTTVFVNRSKDAKYFRNSNFNILSSH